MFITNINISKKLYPNVIKKTYQKYSIDTVVLPFNGSFPIP